MTSESSKRGGVVVLPRDVRATGGRLTALDLSTAGYTPSALLFELRSDAGSTVVELMRFAPARGSWIYATADGTGSPHIERDGVMTMMTRVDALFIALGVLGARKGKMFEPADALLHLDGVGSLTHLIDPEELTLICEEKEAAGETFYRLDELRATRWLVCKICALADAANLPHHDAADAIVQYLSPPWAERLTARFPAPVSSTANTDPTEPASDLNDSQQKALDAILGDARAENEAFERGELETPAKKKQKVVKKAKSTAAPARRVTRSVASYFTKK